MVRLVTVASILHVKHNMEDILEQLWLDIEFILWQCIIQYSVLRIIVYTILFDALSSSML